MGRNYVAFIHAQMAGEFHGKHAHLRIIAAGSEIQPGSEALYVMPHGKYQTLAALARAHARIGLGTANDVGDVMVGALLIQARLLAARLRHHGRASDFS